MTDLTGMDASFHAASDKPAYDQIPDQGYNQKVVFYQHPRTATKIMIQVTTPGIKEEVRRQVRPSDLMIYKRAWDAFQDGREAPEAEGTSLTEIPGMTQERILQLQMLHITKVEQLAVLEDNALQNLGMSALTLRKSAQQVVALKSQGSKEAEIAALKAENAALTKASAKFQEEMNARMAALEDKKPAKNPKPGPKAGAASTATETKETVSD